MAISRSQMERQLRNMGGIMSLEEPRQGYFLGKIVRKAKKAVKKVVKSPVGKAAILGALTFGIPGTQFGGLAGGKGLAGLKGKLFGDAISMGGNLDRGSGLMAKTPGLFGKLGLTKGGGSLGLTGLGKIAGITGLSGLAGLMAAGEQDEEDEIDLSKLDRGEGLNILDIVARARKNDPEFRFLPGAEFTGTYAEGGEVDKSKMIKDMLDRGADDDLIKSITKASQEEIDSVKNTQRQDKADGGTAKDFENFMKEKMSREKEFSQDRLLEEFRQYMLRQKPVEAKEGGLMNLGGMEMDLRGGGFVPLGAKEKADDVPARLSKNEFVMTADAVRAAGGGSVDKGADKMYNMMKNLEAQV